MSPRKVYACFDIYFPQITRGNLIDVWYSYGKNAIRIKLKDHQEYIFTYGGKNDWDLQTFNHFIKNVKGGK